MSYFQHLARFLAHLDVGAQTTSELNALCLDKTYVEIVRQLKELKEAEPYLREIHLLSEADLSAAYRNTDQQLHMIIDAFYAWFQTKPYIGNVNAYENPNFVILLGAHAKETMRLRVECASEFLISHPQAKLILSGGGRSIHRAESKQMQIEAERLGIKNEIFCEPDSMDTVANALFVKFLLLAKKHDLEEANILIVTSRFHTMRALAYFKEIFPQSSSIAALGITTIEGNAEKILAHELASQYEATESLGIFDQDIKLTDQEMMLKLFMHHDFYKNRYDLLRKFLGPMTFSP